jgi:hypothetical protein
MLTVDDLPVRFYRESTNHFWVYLWNAGLDISAFLQGQGARGENASCESLAAGMGWTIRAVKETLDVLISEEFLTLNLHDRTVDDLGELETFAYVVFLNRATCRQFRRDSAAGVIKARVQQWRADQHQQPPAPPPPQSQPDDIPKPLPVPKVLSRKGYVYLVKAETGHYKIGHTTDPDNRMKTFNVKLPFHVEYEHLIKCDDRLDAERRLHQKFADKRVNGEWFALTDKDVAQIKKIKHIRKDKS